MRKENIFTRNLTDVDNGCIDVYSDITGIITSPFYPENYKDFMTCHYTVKAVQGANITIAFNDFKLEYSTGCQYDSLKV